MKSWLLAAAAALAVAACSGDAPDAGSPLPSVTIAQPLVQQVRDWDDYVGRFEAVQAVVKFLDGTLNGNRQALSFVAGAAPELGQRNGWTVESRGF